MGEIIDNKNSLTYPVQVGDQKIILPDNNVFKKKGLQDIIHYYESRIAEIKKQYDELIENYQINKRIYESVFKFEPVIGKIYHLYDGGSNEEFLSLIEPNEWHVKYIGSFRLNSDGRWEKVDFKK